MIVNGQGDGRLMSTSQPRLGMPAARTSLAIKTKGNHPLIRTTAFAALALMVLPFAYYALEFGQRGLRNALPEPHYLQSDLAVANFGIFLHMVFGGVITFLAPIQLITQLRQRFPAVHRWSGRIIATAAIITAIGGLTYIVARGTIGGWPMDAGFSLYGVLTLLTAVRAWQLARRGNYLDHSKWALRFFWLAIGSWLYRVQYGIWYLLTDGLWTTPEFTGAFDLAMMTGFYLPHLIGVEIYLRAKHNRRTKTQTRPI